MGATDRELADLLDVDVSTVHRWKLAHPEFCDAVRAGKDVCDDRVERAFYNRCVGYSFDATKIFMPAGADKPVYAPYVEHVPPDPGAALNWLKNRRGDKWRDKHDHEHSGTINIADAISAARARAASISE